MASGKNRKTVYFKLPVVELIKKYAKDNNRTFSKSVNHIITEALSPKSNHRQVVLDEYTLNLVEKYATQNNTTISEVIRRMIERSLVVGDKGVIQSVYWD